MPIGVKEMPVWDSCISLVNAVIRKAVAEEVAPVVVTKVENIAPHILTKYYLL